MIKFLRENKLFVGAVAGGLVLLVLVMPSIFASLRAPVIERFWRARYAEDSRAVDQRTGEIVKGSLYAFPNTALELRKDFAQLEVPVRKLTDGLVRVEEAKQLRREINSKLEKLRPRGWQSEGAAESSHGLGEKVFELWRAVWPSREPEDVPPEPSAIILDELRDLLRNAAELSPDQEQARAQLKAALDATERMRCQLLTLEELTKKRNDQLSKNKLFFLKRMTFIPPYPYRLPKDELLKGVSFVQILTKAREEVARLASARQCNIETSFGFPDKMDTPPDELVPGYLRQLASAALAAEAAIYSGVDEFKQLQLMEPYTTKPRADYVEFIRFYPFRCTITSSFDSLLEYLHRLEGLHGTVTEVQYFAELREKKVRSVTIDLGARDGLEPYSVLSVFKDDFDPVDGFRYAGNLEVKEVQEDSAVCWPQAESLPEGGPPIEQGDNITSHFFLLKHIDIEAVEPRLERGGAGESARFFPGRLKTEILLATPVFLQTPGEIKIEAKKRVPAVKKPAAPTGRRPMSTF